MATTPPIKPTQSLKKQHPRPKNSGKLMRDIFGDFVYERTQYALDGINLNNATIYDLKTDYFVHTMMILEDLYLQGKIIIKEE